MKLFGVVMVKNESDIIEESLTHYLQHLDKIIVIDNNSEDDTIEIAAKFPEIIIKEHKSNNHDQGMICTNASIDCYNLGANWVVHFDADEFIFGLNFLYDLPNNITKVSICDICEHVLTEYTGNFETNKLPYWLIQPINICYWSKFCKIYPSNLLLGHHHRLIHRAHPDVVVSDSHSAVFLHGDNSFSRNLILHHYPIRSKNQFYNKFINLGLAWSNYNKNPDERSNKWADTFGAHAKYCFRRILFGDFDNMFEEKMIYTNEIEALKKQNVITKN